MDFSPHSEFWGKAPTFSHTAKDSTSDTLGVSVTFPRARAFLSIHRHLCCRSLSLGEKRKVWLPHLAHGKVGWAWAAYLRSSAHPGGSRAGREPAILKNNHLCAPSRKFPWALQDLSCYCTSWSWDFLCPYSQMAVKVILKYSLLPIICPSPSVETHIFPTRLDGWAWGWQWVAISSPLLLCPLTLFLGMQETDIYSLSSERCV